MYERFTDRARKVMQLANQEAHSSNQEFIGTQHILLGLAKEGSGVAAYVLKNLGVDPYKIKLEIEKILVSGPDRVTMGKLPLTIRSKDAIQCAVAAAKELHHNHIGTEHLLLGLLQDPEGISCVILRNLGISLSAVQQEVLRLLKNTEEEFKEEEYSNKKDEPKTDEFFTFATAATSINELRTISQPKEQEKSYSFKESYEGYSCEISFATQAELIAFMKEHKMYVFAHNTTPLQTPTAVSAPTSVCECGAEKAATPHTSWCPKGS